MPTSSISEADRTGAGQAAEPPRAATLVGVMFRHRLVLMALPVLGMLAGFTAAAIERPTFEAVSFLQVAPGESDDDAMILALRILDSGNRLVLNSVAELAESSSVRREAALGIDAATSEFETFGVIDEDANLVWVSVVGPSAEVASQLANATARLVVNGAADLLPAYRVVTLEPAPIPDAPILPQPWLWSLAGAVIGSVAALALINLRLLARRSP